MTDAAADPFRETLDDPSVPFARRWQLIRELDGTNQRLGVYRSFISYFEGWIRESQRRNGLGFSQGHWDHQKSFEKSMASEKVSSSSLSVFEVGSGSGGLSRCLYEYAQDKNLEFNFHLYDSQEDILQESQGLFSPKAKVTTHTATEDYLKVFPDQSFDVVISLHVIHHIHPFAEAVSALEQMLRISRRGVFVMDLYNKPGAVFLTKALSRIVGFSPDLASDGIKSLLRSHPPHHLFEELKNSFWAQAHEIAFHKYAFYPYWRLGSHRKSN